MNLLTDQWIPARPLDGAEQVRIALRDLLCGDGKWELSLPRDDMELAALQLVICLTQVVLMPKDAAELRSRIAKSVQADEFDAAIGPFHEWFQLDHPKYPFMQVRGVKANKITPLDKLMAGLTGATSCCFVNEPNMAATLCTGCTAVALFNQASCTPGFGGGFREPLRSGTPITTLVQGDHLRRTVWLNVLSDDAIGHIMPWYQTANSEPPTWIDPIRPGVVHAQSIGLARGLFWQPAHIELLPPDDLETFCSCCGLSTNRAYKGFVTAKFRSYEVGGTWPHPHSPRTLKPIKEGRASESWHQSFGTITPAWTQLNRFVAKLSPQNKKGGHEPAAVVLQSQQLFEGNAQKLHLLVGGYVRSKASIINRRHEVFTLNHGWDRHTAVIDEIVSRGIGYNVALKSSLSRFCKGIRENKTNRVTAKGLGEKIQLAKTGEIQFYRRSELIIENTLARIDFDNPGPELSRVRKTLRLTVEGLFNELVRPYLNDPELVRTLALARRTLWKHLNGLEPLQDKGGNDGTEKTP